jgi:hypothetical protein
LLAFQEHPIKSNERSSEEGRKEGRCKEKEGRTTTKWELKEGSLLEVEWMKELMCLVHSEQGCL